MDHETIFNFEYTNKVLTREVCGYEALHGLAFESCEPYQGTSAKEKGTS